jgi:hypothetical protein
MRADAMGLQRALCSCMSVSAVARPAAFGRALAAAGPGATRSIGYTRRLFSVSAARLGSVPGANSSNRNGGTKQNASSWSLSGVYTIATAAVLLGWGFSEARYHGFPTPVLLDSRFPIPKYANMREMEVVCCTDRVAGFLLSLLSNSIFFWLCFAPNTTPPFCPFSPEACPYQLCNIGLHANTSRRP